MPSFTSPRSSSWLAVALVLSCGSDRERAPRIDPAAQLGGHAGAAGSGGAPPSGGSRGGASTGGSGGGSRGGASAGGSEGGGPSGGTGVGAAAGAGGAGAGAGAGPGPGGAGGSPSGGGGGGGSGGATASTCSAPCGADATCITTAGAPHCRCNPGFAGDGSTCTAVSAPTGYVVIPAGSFWMGAPADEVDVSTAEQPRHLVTLTRSFLLAAREVTQDDWVAITSQSPFYHDTCGGSCPAEMLTWYDALAYVNALSLAGGLSECYTLADCQGTAGAGLACTSVAFAGLDCEGYRLPTEAEWEYAARAGTTTAIFPGELTDPWNCSHPELDPICWYICNTSQTPEPVGTSQPNGWGLYDMPGNVQEWVWDWYAPNYDAGAVTDPLGPSSGTLRVLRSAYIAHYGPDCRSARRDAENPAWVSNGVGLRPARTVP